MPKCRNTLSDNQVQWAQPDYATLVEEISKIKSLSDADQGLAFKQKLEDSAVILAKKSLDVLHNLNFLPNRVAPCTLAGGIALIYIKDRNYAEIHCLNTGEVHCIMISSGSNGRSSTESRRKEFQISPPVDTNTIPESYDKMLKESARRICEFLNEHDNKGGEPCKKS